MERRGWGEPGWAGGGLHPSAGPGLKAAGPGPHPRAGMAAFLAFLLSFPHCLFVCFKLDARNSFCLLDSAVLEPPPGRATEPSSTLPGPPPPRDTHAVGYSASQCVRGPAGPQAHGASGLPRPPRPPRQDLRPPPFTPPTWLWAGGGWKGDSAACRAGWVTEDTEAWTQGGGRISDAR